VGFRLGYSSDCTLTSNTAFNNGYIGIGLVNSSDNTLTSNGVSNNTVRDFGSEGSHGNVVTDLTIASYPTTISFTYDDVGLKGVDTAPSDHEGKVNINKYVNVTGYSADSWISLHVSYHDSDLGGVDEDSLRMWQYDGTWTEVPPPNGVNTAENYVYANISSFSIFAPLGNATGTQPSIAISTDKYEYHPGDTMTMTVDIENPTASSVDTYFGWLLRLSLPEYIYQKPMLVTRLTLPPFFDQTFNMDIYVGNWATIGVNAEWYVALAETSAPYDIICDDTAEWRYDPVPVSSPYKDPSKGGSAPPEEVVPEQIAEAIMNSIGEIGLPVEQAQEEEITEEILGDIGLERRDDTEEWQFGWLPAP